MDEQSGYPAPMRLDLDRFRDGLLRVQRRLGDVRATAESDDGLVEVAVGGRGELLELTLDPRVFRNTDARALADDILGTVRRATAVARDEVYRLTRDSLPAHHDPADVDLDFDPALDRLAAQGQAFQRMT